MNAISASWQRVVPSRFFSVKDAGGKERTRGATSSCQYNNINTHVRGRGPVYSVTTPILYSIGWSIVIKCPRQGRIVLWGMYSIMLCVCKMELYYYTMGPRIVQLL